MTGPAPAIYVGHLVHVRRTPSLRTFRHTIALWLVDLDDMPVLPRWMRPLARWSARDHVGPPHGTIRGNLDRWLAGHGVDLAGGRVLMLSSPRVLGYVFNPLTVYWCHDASGALHCTVAEVTNTYGERHCYLLPAAAPEPVEGHDPGRGPDDGPAAEGRDTEDGRDDARGHGSEQPADRSEFDVPKVMRVSPFFDAGGRYRMRLPLPDRRLSLTVALRDGDATPLTAVFTARHHDVTPRLVLSLVLSGRLAPQRVMALIRLHGIRLWLRGTPIRSGPHHREGRNASS